MHHDQEVKKRSVRDAASFRDPSGYVYEENGVLYRAVNEVYRAQYDRLMQSGLYEELVKKGLLIPHEETAENIPGRYKTFRPERIPFISYPYEWCFSELKDAALATLRIERIAEKYGMTLKDASAYNIQFRNGKPVLIDTLSFEQYREGAPWVAYRQFCEHFLAPLALMSMKEIRLEGLLRMYPNGIPLEFASKLLPWRSWLSPGTFFHIHMHAKNQRKYAGKKVNAGAGAGFDREAMAALIANLKTAVNTLRWEPKGTEWDEYYDHTNYSDASADEKFAKVREFVRVKRPGMVWDIGANEGLYSRAASDQGIETVAFDIDPASVEKNYRAMKEKGEPHLLPLVMDIANPSPSLGWADRERASLAERGPADMVLALALVHHLAITYNIPFGMMADYCAEIGKSLVVEFVPKDDSQAERLLKNRADIFSWYTEEQFEKEFSRKFSIRERSGIAGSKRALYLMDRR